MDTPVPQSPQSQQQQLPHLIVDEPKRSPWAIIGIVVLSLMVLAIPVGLFLVQQKTNLTPQAAVSEPQTDSTNGIILEPRPSLNGVTIPVDIYVRSSSDAINLSKIKLKFDPVFLSVEKIATDEANEKQSQTFNKWLEASYDNSLGFVTLISGLPTPGIKTSGLSEDRAYFATVNFNQKQSGSTIIQSTQDSVFLRNLDSQNVFLPGRDLVLNLPQKSIVTPNQTTPALQNSSDSPILVITSPLAVTNYTFFKPIDIMWSAFNLETISEINLYVNGAILGPVAKNLEAKSGRYTWNPQESLSLPYIQPANSFMIEITGFGKKGERARAITGPFGIAGVENVSGSPPNPEVFYVNSLSVEDASRLLSAYLVLPLEDKSLDFNNDDVINDLDLYLLRQNLLRRGVIK